jgi:glutathione S-transferase
MKLYAHPLSLFSAKVRIALAEKGLRCDVENVPLSADRGYEPKHPQVLTHNPKQQVPVLLDGDLALYDSTVILEYLEDLAPAPALYPREAKARARCRLLELEADELFFAPVGTLIRRRYARAAGVAEDPNEWPEAVVAVNAACTRLSQQLGDSEFLCGAFSVADIAHFLVASFAAGFGLPIPAEHVSLTRWFGTIAARPAVPGDLVSMFAALRTLQSGADATAAVSVSF